MICDILGKKTGKEEERIDAIKKMIRRYRQFNADDEKILNLLVGLILIDSIPDLLEFNNSLLGFVKLIINILTVLICLYILKEVNKNE